MTNVRILYKTLMVQRLKNSVHHRSVSRGGNRAWIITCNFGRHCEVDITSLLLKRILKTTN